MLNDREPPKGYYLQRLIQELESSGDSTTLAPKLPVLDYFVVLDHYVTNRSLQR